jgi:hypothetical protein
MLRTRSGKACGRAAAGANRGTSDIQLPSNEKMRRTGVFSVIACGLVLLPACTLEQVSRLGSDEKADAPPPLEAPEGYRAELRQTPWALERVSKNGTVVWIWTAESGCNRFHHVSVREAAGGLRVVAFDVVYIPVSKKYGCPLPLYRDLRRVELPRPLGGDRISGECVPGDPRETCASLHAVVHTREGEERDPWLE